MFFDEAHVCCQELYASALKVRENEILNNLPLDNDGNKSAMIRVYLSATGADFSENSMMLTSGENRNGLYVLYFANGTKRIKIKHNNYLPLTIEFRDLGIKYLESGKSYELQIVTLENEHGVSFEDCPFSESIEKARNGNPDAQFHVAQCYEMGDGVDEDVDESLKWYEKAAENGHPKALSYMIEANLKGRIPFGTRQKAKRYIQLGLNKGVKYGPFLRNSAYCIQMDGDFEKAYMLYKEAFELGYYAAGRDLGFMNEHAIGVPKDLMKALEYYEIAWEKGHDMGALYNLATQYSNRGEEEKALKLYKLGISLDQANSAGGLGLKYAMGQLGLARNVSEAEKLCIKAADLGDPSYFVDLAVHEYSQSIAFDVNNPDYKMFFKRLLMAEEKYNCSDAKFWLASLYQTLDGDEQKARKRLIDAAQREVRYGDACFLLGRCMIQGEMGFKQNKDLGIEWLRQAVKLGNKRAQKMLSMLNL